MCTPSLPSLDMDLTVTEASSSDSRGERAELYAHIEEGLLGGETSYLGPPLTPEKEEALHQATAVANLRAALMSKNSLLSLKADVLGDDGPLLFEYLPKGAHSLSRKCNLWRVAVSSFDLKHLISTLRSLASPRMGLWLACLSGRLAVGCSQPPLNYLRVFQEVHWL